MRDLRTPALSGFSGETLLFDACWTDGAARRVEQLVARVAPTGYRLFPDADFGQLVRLLRVLGERTDLPVPRVRWYEPDPALLGGPFLVMDHVAGQVPPDSPTYHQDGWVAAVTGAERARLWWGGLEMMARVHRLDPGALGLGFLDRPELGRPGLDQQLAYYERFLPFSYAGAQPAAEAALAWLRREQPAEPEPPRLLWGDSRIGNVIYRDCRPVAVLDWEMASLGPPEADLAWFLYLDRHHSEGAGAARLPGFPSPAETVARYEQLLGRRTRDLGYHEVFAALRFAIIMARLGQLFIDFEWLPPDSDFPVDNTAARLLATVLAERGVRC